MPRFNQLTRTDTVSAGDIVAVFIQNQGDPRGAAMSVLQEYMQENLNFEINEVQQFTTQYSSPSSTGFSVSISDGPANIHLILTPTTGVAAGTIVLPSFANAVDKQEVLVNCTQQVTSLTVNPNGAVSVTGAPSSLSADAFFRLKYDLPSTVWYRIG